MKIAISGCGITGSTVGFLLTEQGHDVTIFEQATECQPVGAGILLQPSGQEILKRLGMLGEIEAKSERLEGLVAVKPSGKSLVELRYDLLNDQYFGLGVHRGNLYQLLLERCRASNVKIVTDQKVSTIKTDAQGAYIVVGDRATDGPFDFVIAADGSRSALRRSTLQISSNTIEYDYAAMWTTGKCDYQPGKLVQFVNGTRNLAGLLPIGNDHSSFFWGLPADDYSKLVEQPLDDWKKQVMLFCPQAESMLDNINSFKSLTFARYQHVIMKKNFAKQIVFLGDAAHGTSPHLGQGVNLALEDAWCFANLVNKTKDFEEACKQFHRNRHRKLRYYQQVTRILTPFFQADGFVKGMLRDTFLPWFPFIPIVRREMIRTLCGVKKGWIG